MTVMGMFLAIDQETCQDTATTLSQYNQPLTQLSTLKRRRRPPLTANLGSRWHTDMTGLCRISIDQVVGHLRKSGQQPSAKS